MAAKKVHQGLEPVAGADAAAAQAYWSRCEAALAGSRITVAASDREGRYTWVFNPPTQLSGDVIGKTDRDVLAADAAKTLTGIRETVISSGEPRSPHGSISPTARCRRSTCALSCASLRIVRRTCSR
jgi:hypothetical protein